MLLGFLQDITDIFQDKEAMPSISNKVTVGLIMLVCALMLVGCASPGATLKVRPQKEAGIQYSPQEISRMMDILGYQRLLTRDPDTDKSVAIATGDGEYLMSFQFREDTSIQVAAYIVIGNGTIRLHIYQSGSETLDSTATEQYEILRQRLILQYGAEHVSVGHPAFTR
jgi:hypothetical protein